MTSGTSGREGTCGGSSAPEKVYRWTPSTTGAAIIDTCGASFDTIIYVRDSTCTDSLAQIDCVDDSCSSGLGSNMAVWVEAGTTYYIIVDGIASGSGSYTLTVDPPGLLL